MEDNFEQLSDDNGLRLRGRRFDIEDIGLITTLVYEYFDRGRTFISQAVCEELNWKQPNGWLKDRACRDVLRELESQGFFRLPKPQATYNNGRRNTARPHDVLAKYDLITPLETYPTRIEYVFSKGNQYEPLWNALIQNFHYLGYRTPVGRSIKYLIVADDRLIGAIGYSSPAWNIASRDRILDILDIRDPLQRTINNSRFLILPHVRVKNLASKVLSQATSKVKSDWASYYSVEPLLAETFVSPSRFQGTCYRAANWVEIGVTKGYAKRGSHYRNSQEPKLIFLYGMEKHIRKKLLQLEPWRCDDDINNP